MDESRAKPLMIVTGSTLRAEEADRPLAYYLKQQVEKGLAALDHEPAAFRVIVVADAFWLREDALQGCPTISLGGPGVNLLAHRWLEELPLSLAVDDQYYIQMDPDLDEPRVSIWGMDNTSTQIAVSAFTQRLMTRFLQHCTALAAEFPCDLDEE